MIAVTKWMRSDSEIRSTKPLLAAPSQGPAGNPVVPPLPGGRWEGTVNQPGFGPYPAVMQLQATPAGMPTGTMAYASLRCTASLSFMNNEGNKVWFREAIQEGKGKCVDGGRTSISKCCAGQISRCAQ